MLRQPNPWLFGPLLVAATVSLAANLQIALPNGASQIGQWLIGSGPGLSLQPRILPPGPSFLARTLLATALCMAIAGSAAWVLSEMTALDLRSLTLA